MHSSAWVHAYVYQCARAGSWEARRGALLRVALVLGLDSRCWRAARSILHSNMCVSVVVADAIVLLLRLQSRGKRAGRSCGARSVNCFVVDVSDGL
jgi:hypothetical protein